MNLENTEEIQDNNIDKSKEENASLIEAHDNQNTNSHTHFTNNQIDIESLPKIQDVSYTPLEKNHLYVSYIITGIFALIMITSLTIGAYFEEHIGKYYIPLLIIFILFFLFIMFSSKKSFDYTGYALREHDLIYREGWLWKSIATVPFNRIQHIEVNQGPFDRLFDLATITVYTAGGSSSDLEIDGILQETAYTLKEFIMKKNKGIQDDSSEE
ncbi:MAG: hypothetical protein RLZZ546_2555 [Bacteroidota bacterium]|jgi:membrane protein YdbS with pleckstrin-like domain